ncbi:anti-sigma regulatory factor [Amycolatopsis decaplanina]|uniref:Anti-sigma regulatory factor, serine/threonine protein kinase n=1 Tax=Amycolatopsis decaplanina DSM 44594 TaxID=1284240 RepID=M2XIN4_9PSEU|nr:anti-sigma regulatory factor [Amycolatopsis decaplanina]EME60906.1 anti-sigma regulatory factor, serine/threonine protein kinase [Amycolatopsis decaplanina DSM 44594]
MLPDELTDPGRDIPPREHDVRAEEDLLTARHAVRSSAVAAGFSIVDQTKIVTAASELVRNAYIHGGGGTMTIIVLRDDRGRIGLRLRVRDNGPGIADVEQAMTDGFSTGAGLGHGLGGTRRLVDEFTIDTAPGRGTTITIARWKP